ncbi:MAG: 50S ribosomal protein L4 [Candidatus Nealsonbacteria bacterium CG_4_9_14_0_2_um_filter_37_38]|uniref:Large ribosomal subunit protein uL4 n=1 Tax=Candidatus Nealsonbacteria bacterium CG_4_10_14_0_8_um_filter_37_14 TaxID=1974684 RepID=A0A2M7R621_9BACT|nr:MAG: 50S ribosomal protein L4 [Candidatus Nealsonbacteria bacterium CG_4_8_14_3_um_filter_37_23]PIY88967.1 MAG: 50S ribosomal protein L4 [Candidatus Nealsonbacteria bacterium CG_4_10_14_0_8_um_filter_37_14]PJC51529.1 MAG: 50S ribosomal protein L4 [Candidatus Nealsonbacteria bacterium CG_4_9_14_0_2_um_filter_37_38]
MKVSVYDQQGKEIGTTLLPKEIFDVKLNPDLVHQVATSQMANRRQVIAHTKDRGEVRGGGKKPWRQKGTGRARHGSIRSPLWKGGGVTFGPTKERNFKKIIPKKMKRKALFMVLSAKAKENLLIILDTLKLPLPKTKVISQILARLPIGNNSCLIGLPGIDKNIILAARNIHKVRTIQAKDLNALDLLSFKYLLIPKESIEVIKKTFLG